MNLTVQSCTKEPCPLEWQKNTLRLKAAPNVHYTSHPLWIYCLTGKQTGFALCNLFSSKKLSIVLGLIRAQAQVALIKRTPIEPNRLMVISEKCLKLLKVASILH